MTIEKEPLPAGTSPGRGRIVVGVDGSPGSLAAMRWALSEASWRGADVHAIGAWTYPGGRGSGVSAADGPSPGDVLAKAMEATIAAATAPTSGGAAPPVVTVIVSVVHGDPAWELPAGSGEGDETPDPVEPVGSP
jgi:nucleotide-binding universal stress UspA family protein